MYKRQPRNLCAVNQFPYESCLVRKDLLVQLVRVSEALEKSPRPWRLDAFDLETELPAFVRASRDHDPPRSRWMVKPAQLARGRGVMLADSVELVVASMRTNAGDIVAQEYLERPLCVPSLGGAAEPRNKFDVRLVVVVRSFAPVLEAWAAVGALYARVALKPYSMEGDALHDKRVQLTVHRYDADADVNGVDNLLSRSQLREVLGDETWSRAETSLVGMVRDVLCAASLYVGPYRTMSRGAVYGFDAMFDEAGQAKLLEVNFCPDLTGTCRMCPASPRDGDGLNEVLRGVLKVLRGDSDPREDPTTATATTSDVWLPLSSPALTPR